MKSGGLVYNHKRVLLYFFMLIFGLSLMFYGLITFYYQNEIFNARISDDEIRSRAKSLGLVEIKENIKNNE